MIVVLVMKVGMKDSYQKVQPQEISYLMVETKDQVVVHQMERLWLWWLI